MDINPILDSSGVAKAGLWYVLTPENDGPSPRVGHTCCVRKGDTDSSDSMVIIGGANPDGAFNDAYILDFDNYLWENCEWSGLPERYEHSAFIPGHQPNEMIVFGGAKKDGNLNDVQVLDTEAKSWCITLPSGSSPSQRTCHSAAAVGDKLYIFGGGKTGTEPVGDNVLHVYNAKENHWSQPTVAGPHPSCRHGHVMLAVDGNIYIHGGMAGTQIFADLWQLKIDKEKMLWCQPVVSGDIPSERAAHAGASFGKRLYIFGGMNVSGALDDLFTLDTDLLVWQQIKCEGPPASSRLDHTMCAVTLYREHEGSEEPSKVKQSFLVVFGGMDTTGVIFDDCMAFLLEET